MKNNIRIWSNFLLAFIVTFFLFRRNIISFLLIFFIFICIIIFFNSKRRILDNETVRLSKIDKLICGITAIFSAVTFSDGNLLRINNYSLSLFLFLIVSVSFFYFLNKDLLFYMYYKVRTKHKKTINYWSSFCVIFFTSLIYFLAYYPGVFTVDSINQWDQIYSSVPWNDWHPVGHTFMLKLATITGNNPATFVIFQIVIYSFTMAYFFKIISRFFFNDSLVLLHLFFVLVPLFPLFSVYIIKDSLFTYCLILYILCLIDVVSSKGIWLSDFKNLLILFFSILGVLFFRHNGWPVFIVTSIILGIFLLKKEYVKLHIVSVICIFVYLIVTGPIYNKVNVIRGDSTESLGIFVQISANIITNEGEMTQDETDYFNTLMSENNWKELYKPGDVDSIKFKQRFNKSVIRNNPEKFIKNSISIILKNPLLSIEAYAKQTEIIWHANMDLNQMRPLFRDKMEGKQGPFYFMSEEQKKIYNPDYTGIDFDKFSSNWKWLHDVIGEAMLFIQNSKLYFFLMPSLYLIIIVFSILVIFRKGNSIMILPFVPYLLNLGTMFIGIPAQDVRYVFSNYFVAFLALAVAFNTNKSDKNELENTKL